jgi:hypothetical protein
MLIRHHVREEEAGCTDMIFGQGAAHQSRVWYRDVGASVVSRERLLWDCQVWRGGARAEEGYRPVDRGGVCRRVESASGVWAA